MARGMGRPALLALALSASTFSLVTSQCLIPSDGGNVLSWSGDNCTLGENVTAGTCCAPTCKPGYKPSGSTTCSDNTTFVACVPVTCDSRDAQPRPFVDMSDGEHNWMRSWVVVFTIVGVGAIGANNLGNALAPAVASQAMSLRTAALLGVVFEFFGAWILGSSSLNVVYSHMINLEVFGGSPEVLMLAMLCASIASAATMLVAALRGIPISAMHATGGALVGVVAVWQNKVEALEPCGTEAGGEATNCIQVAEIVWRIYVVGLIAMLLAGGIAYALRSCCMKGGGADSIARSGCLCPKTSCCPGPSPPPLLVSTTPAAHSRVCSTLTRCASPLLPARNRSAHPQQQLSDKACWWCRLVLRVLSSHEVLQPLAGPGRAGLSVGLPAAVHSLGPGLRRQRPRVHPEHLWLGH